MEHHFDLYGFLPDDISSIPTPPLMDPSSVSFHLLGIYAKDIPYNIRVRPTFVDSPKGNGKPRRTQKTWAPSPEGGLIFPMNLPPLYPGDRVRLFGTSKWTWTHKHGHGIEPRTKTSRPIVLGALFSLQWIPLRKSDRTHIVTEQDPTIGLEAAPRQEHGLSLARNTPWARKLKKTTAGASSLAKPTPAPPPKIPKSDLEEGGIETLADGTPVPPKHATLPSEAEQMDWAAEYRKR